MVPRTESDEWAKPEQFAVNRNPEALTISLRGHATAADRPISWEGTVGLHSNKTCYCSRCTKFPSQPVRAENN